MKRGTICAWSISFKAEESSSVLSGCHVDTTLINMHNTPKISAEGHGYPLRVGPK